MSRQTIRMMSRVYSFFISLSTLKIHFFADFYISYSEKQVVLTDSQSASDAIPNITQVSVALDLRPNCYNAYIFLDERQRYVINSIPKCAVFGVCFILSLVRLILSLLLLG